MNHKLRSLLFPFRAGAVSTAPLVGKAAGSPSEVFKKPRSSPCGIEACGWLSRWLSQDVKSNCRKLVEWNFFTFVMTILTVFALFGDDVKFAATSKSADEGFNIVAIISLVMFGIEIILASIGKDDYFMGFFFWLDVISTLSLVSDISYVWDYIQEAAGDSTSDSTQLARAGRAGRAGSKAGRVIRIVRIVRLIRIVKLYKHAMEHNVERSTSLSCAAPGDPLFSASDMLPNHDVERGFGLPSAEDSTPMEPESRVGKKLSDLTTRRVIILVLVMLLAFPLLSSDTWVSEPHSGEFGIHLITDFSRHIRTSANYSSSDQRAYDQAVVNFVNYHKRHGDFDLSDYLFFVKLPVMVTSESVGLLDGPRELLRKEAADKGVSLDHNIPSPEALRSQETSSYSSERCALVNVSAAGSASNFTLLECRSGHAVFNLKYSVRLAAGLSIVRTVFICLVLSLGALFFSKDANELVLNPIERMIAKMERIRENPLAAAKMGDEYFLDEEEVDAPLEPRVKGIFGFRLKPKKRSQAPYETVVLENTIIRIGGLLALGFGEAGAEIIANNMKSSDGGLNAMVEGRKITAIFGFCDIRQFTDATEVLREKVMVFVNQIAEIVHGIVDEHGGAANKNIGDAFLLVWKYPEAESANGVREQIDDSSVISKMADMALMSFLKIIAAISKSPILAEYGNNKELCERIPNYEVKMGFGLHVGWAVEGAIGSDFKIDASYLSPNVNMASRLEAATKQYGVPVLISGALFAILSPQTQAFCRQLDRVTVKGSKLPMSLYTVDVSTAKLELDEMSNKPVSKGKARRQRETQKARLWSTRFSVYSMFDSDKDMLAMREHLSEQFLQTFRRAYSHYEAGEWKVARDFFTRTQYMLGVEDGPSATLLYYMGEHRFEAPDNWEGYRELTEK